MGAETRQPDILGAAVVSLGLVLLIAYAPGLAFFLLPLALAPLSEISQRHSPRETGMLLAACAAVAAVFLIFGSHELGTRFTLLFSALALPAFVLTFNLAARRRLSGPAILFLCGAAIAVAGLAADRILIAAGQGDFFAAVARELGRSLSGSMIPEDGRRSFAAFPISSFNPSILAALALSIAGLALTLYDFLFESRFEPPDRLLQPLSRWVIPWQLSYGFLAGLGSLFYRSGWAYSHEVRVIGFNLLMIFGVVFFVQGLAVVAALAGRLRKPARSAVMFLAIIAQYFFQILTWIGLLDVWFDYRKQYRKGLEERQ